MSRPPTGDALDFGPAALQDLLVLGVFGRGFLLVLAREVLVDRRVECAA